MVGGREEEEVMAGFYSFMILKPAGFHREACRNECLYVYLNVLSVWREVGGKKQSLRC